LHAAGIEIPLNARDGEPSFPAQCQPSVFET
jgi:hypothetical protein